MACDNVIITKENYEERPNDKELKQSIYSANMITDEILTNLFSSEVSNAKQFEELFEGDSPTIPYKSVLDKVSSLKYFDESKMPFGKKIGEIVDGDDIRDITIALSQLISVNKSEQDLTRKYNLDAKAVESVQDNTDPSKYQTSYSNIARTIGREILKTRGYRLIPKNEKGIKDSVAYETKIGEKALQKLEDRGLLSITESGTIVNRNFRDPNPDNMKDINYTKGKRKKVLTGIKTVVLLDLIEDTATQEDRRSISGNIAATRALISPPNSAVPSSTPKEINRQAQDMNMLDKHEEILEHVQDNPLRVTPFMKEAIDDLSKRIKSTKGSTKGTLMGLADFISSSKSSPFLFGTIDSEELNAIMMGDPVGIEQNYGRSQSKTIQFSRVLDVWDDLQDSLFYSFQTANQNRAHVLEQTLSYQSDNFLSRHVLGSDKVQEIADPADIRYVISYIADETGLAPADILGGTKSSALLDEYVGYLDDKDKNNDSALGLIATMANNLDKGKSPFNKPSKSAWELMSYVQAVKDIRDGINNDGVVRTHFMPKPDATASGAVITLLQAARYGGYNEEVAKDLIEGNLKDAYDLSVKELDSRLKSFSNKTTKDAFKTSHKDSYLLIKKLSDYKTGIIDGPRELMKLPFTKFIYGQNKDNNVQEITKEMASLIIEQQKTDLAKEILGDNYTADTIELRAALEKELGKEYGVAYELVTIIDETTGKSLFDRQGEELGDMHKLMEEARFSEGSTYGQIKVVPPLAWINSDRDLTNLVNYEEMRDGKEGEKGYATVIEKYFEAVLTDKDGALTTIKKRYPNENSIKVLLQHMMDAAILYESLGETEGFETYFNGFMLNHDSIGAEVTFARNLEPVYKRKTMEINSEYDFKEAALMELKYARSRTTEPSLLEKMDALITKTEEQLKTEIPNKQKVLSSGKGIIDNAFGVKPSVLKEAEALDLSPRRVKKTKEGKVVNLNAEKELNNLRELIENDPDSVITYDLETDSVDTKVANLVQIGYKKGTNPATSINIQMTQEQAGKYIEALKGTPIEDSQLYKDILLNYRADNNMADWNKEALPLVKAVKEFKSIVDDSKALVSFNGRLYDDKVLKAYGVDVKTTHDMRNLSQDSVVITGSRKGKLSDLADKAKWTEDQLHNADIDVEVTFEAIGSKTETKPTPDNVLSKDAVEDFKSNVKLFNKVSQTIILESFNVNPSVNIVSYTKDITPYYDLATNTVHVNQTMNEELFAHEFVHATIAQKIENDPVYAGKVKKLYDKVMKEDPSILEGLKDVPDADILHEFMAVALADKTTRNKLKKVPYGKRIIDAAVKLVFAAFGVSPNKYGDSALGEAITLFYEATYDDSIVNPDKKLNYIDVVTEKYKGYRPELKDNRSIIERTSNVMIDVDSYVSSKIQSTIDYTIGIDRDKETITSKSHDYMMENSDIYKNTFNAITDQWDSNTFINKMKFYLDLDEKARRKEFNVLNTQSIHAEERKAQFETDKMNELYDDIEGLFTKAETSTLYSLLSETPIAYLGKDDVFKGLLKKEFTIDEKIKDLLDNSTLNAKAKKNIAKKAQELSEFYINKKAPKGLATDRNFEGDSRVLVGQLSALYAMQKIPNVNSILHKINSTKRHRKVVNKLLELSSAVQVLDDELYGTISLNYDTHTGNLNHKVFEGNIEVKHVNAHTINKEFREDLGWKILEHPADGKAGIMYRNAGDITFQGGLGTQLKLQPDLQVTIPKSYGLERNNAMSQVNGDRSTVVFTNDQLDTMGMVRDPIVSLVKGYSHRMLLQETQSIRKELVNEFTDVYSKKDDDKLKQKIKDREHNWYLNLPEGITIDQLPKEIRSRYKLSRSSSDVDDFASQVTLVRSDMADFVEGYKEIQIGGTNTKLNKVFSVVKKTVLLQKIHWVITAPVKIAMDTTSNLAYLLSRNIPITTVYSKTKRIANDMVEFTKLREELLHAEFKNRANPSKTLAKKIESLEEKIKTHRMSSAYFRGFIQSIAIDISQKNEHTAAGLHKDVGSILTKIFRNDTGSLNRAGKAVDYLSKFAINGEDILLRVSAIAKAKGSSNVAKATADMLEDIANNIKRIKDKSDVEAYIQEYMATPGTALVNVGSVLVQTPDVIAKVILHEHLVEQKVRKYRDSHNGRGPDRDALYAINEEAAIESVTSFIDYKMNIPRELRLLEQTGVTSFISFWSRIQKVILVSLRNNPVNALITILINEMLNLDGGTILDASFVEKWGSGSLAGSYNPGMDVLFPTKLAG